MITQLDYQRARNQINAAKNKDKLIEPLVIEIEKCGEHTSALERYWLAKGVIIGYLIAKEKEKSAGTTLHD